MRVTYVVGTFPLLTTTFIARERAALAALGHRSTVVSIRRPPPGTASTDPRAFEGVDWLLPPSPLGVLGAHLRFLVRRPRAYLGLLVRLPTRRHPSLRARLRTVLHFGLGVVAADRIRRDSPALIHAHFVDRAAIVALIASRLLRVPYSVTAHARDIYADPVLLPEKLRGAAFVVTVSERNRRHLLAATGIAPDRIHVLHPWVPAAALAGPPAVAGPGRPLRIVSVGRLVEKKGHATLVEACAILRDRGVDVRCAIAGEGPLRPDLEAQIARLNVGERVHLLGGVPEAEVAGLLRAADLFVLACRVGRDGDRDGMPVAIAEAMAAGLPVVSTTLEGIEELVRPGAGTLVPPEDPAALADAIAAIAAATPEERAAMGRAGRAVVADAFALEAGVARLADLMTAAGSA